MSKATDGLLSYIRVVAGTWKNDPRDDAELVARFAENRDEAAFAVLVSRHGALVWQTCRRLLGETPDAEDAFQTVFLALTRKAGRFPVKSLVGWLYRVSRQTALKIRSGSQRRRKLEQKRGDFEQSEAGKDPSQAELFTSLDEELARLPEKLRIPLLLHYLEGKTQVEVARILGCDRSVVQYRLKLAEAALRKQLGKRGLALGGISSVAALLESTSGAITAPARLVESTARAALAFRAGTLTGGSAEAAEKLLQSLSLKGVLSKGWWAMLVCISILCVGGGVGLVVWKMCGGGSSTVVSLLPEPLEPLAPKETVGLHHTRVDCYGDPLPAGAIARIGTVRFRVRSLGGTASPVFLPNGKTLVSTHRGEAAVHFWETATGKEIRRLDGPAYEHKMATISSDGRKLAVCGNEAWVWDLSVDTPRLLWRQKLELLKGWPSVAFTPDGKTLAVCYGRGENKIVIGIVKLFNAETGEVLQEYNQRGKEWAPLIFSTDGKTLAAGDTLWNVETGKKRLVLRHKDKQGHFHDVSNVYSMSFSPDSKTIAIRGGYSYDRAYYFFNSLLDSATGAERCQIPTENGDTTRGGNRFYTFLYDGQTLLEILKPGMGDRSPPSMRFLDSVTGREKLPTETKTNITCNYPCQLGQNGQMCLSPDCKFIADATGPEISLYDTTMRRWVEPAGYLHGYVRAMAFSPDSKILATLTRNSQPEPALHLWKTETGQLDRKLDSDRGIAIPLIDYSNNNKIALIPYASGRFINWDIMTGKTSKGQASPFENALHCAVSPDGRWQFWSSEEASVLVDRSTGKVVRRFEELDCHDTNGFLAVSDDGRSVVFHRRENGVERLEVWSAKTGRRQMVFTYSQPYKQNIHGENFYFYNSDPEKFPVALSPDARWLAIASDVAVRIWEVGSGSEGRIFEAQKAVISSIAWSPDGRFLAGGDKNGVLWIWDAVADQEARRFTGHRGPVTALTFSPDGCRLASGSSDTTALVWDMRCLPRQLAKPTQLPSADEIWSALRKAEAAGAREVMHLLIQNPDIALPLLNERLRPAPVSNPKQIAALLAQLDDNDFHVRNQAEEQLVKKGRMIEPALQEALAKKPSLEVQQRICSVLGKLDIISSEQLQVCRGVEVLERIGTPAARQILEKLASRLPPGMLQADEAKAALQRLIKSDLVPSR